MNVARKPLIFNVYRLASIVGRSRPHPSLSSATFRSSDSLGCKYEQVCFSSSRKESERPVTSPVFREVDEYGFQIPIEDSTRYTAEEKAYRKKMGRYYSLLIAGLIGFISSSYLLYKRMLNVEAKSVEDSANNRNEEDGDHHSNVSGKNDVEIALHKSKAGFRERKVGHLHFTAYCVQSSCFKLFTLPVN